MMLCDKIENATRTNSVRRSPAAARKRSITFAPLWACGQANRRPSQEEEGRTPLEQIDEQEGPIRAARERFLILTDLE